MNANKTPGLASIIIPCWNQLEFTRHCIASLVRHTRAPWELIVVDNGSTDHTDVGVYGHLTKRNLAKLVAKRGDFAEEQRLWPDVLAECPRGAREAEARRGDVKGL